MKNKYLLLLVFGFLTSIVNAQFTTGTSLSVIPNVPAKICNPGDPASLSCTFYQTFQQTGYSVSSIPFTSPFGTTSGTATNITIDDRFTKIIDLKGLTPSDFNFCFYDKNYSKCLISTNGAITFSVAGYVPGGIYQPSVNTPEESFSYWVLSSPLPWSGSTSGNQAPLKASINGVFQDTNPQTNNAFAHPNINYFTAGTAPNRVFVVNFNELAQYNCGSDPAVGAQTSQIVLYEGSNIIDIYIKRRVPCMSWPSNVPGNGLAGIQNETGTLATVPPGRNCGTGVGAWTANNEGWRFKPTGVAVSPTLTWTNTATGAVVGTGTPITVNPTEDTQYTVTASYPTCNPAVRHNVSANVTVSLVDIPAGTASDIIKCNTGAPNYSFDFTANGNAIMAPLNASDYEPITYHTSAVSAQSTDADMITGSTTNYLTSGGTVTIWACVVQTATDCRKVIPFNLIVRNCTSSPVQPPNMVLCDDNGNGTESFNLTTQNNAILGGQAPADYTITYHTTLASADGTLPNSALIPAGAAIGQNQNFVSSGQTIYVRMESATNAASFGTTSFQLIVNPKPTVVVTNPSGCDGSSVTIGATPSPAGTYSYVWTVPSGASNPGSVASFSTSVAGVYSVIATNTVTGCDSASASGTVTINALPTVTVNSPTTCAGGSVNLTAVPLPAGPSYSYVWTVPAGVTNPGNVASFSTTVGGTYSVVVTNPSTTCSSVPGVGTVSINALPTVSVPDYSVCSGTSATVTATPSPAGTYNYAWTVPAGFANPGNVPSFATTIAGTYSVVITDPVTLCSSTSDSGVVTVNTLPTVSVANVSACAGTSATVTAVPVPAGTYNYVWTVPAGATNPGNVASFGTTIAGTYSVVVTNTTTNCSSASASGTVTINAKPTVTVNNSSICSGETATVTASPVPAAGTYNYVWTVPAGATNPGNVATFTTTTAGSYSVVITDTTTGCSSTSASGTVTINPAGGSMNLQCGAYNSAGHPGEIYIDWSNVAGITSFNYSYSINGGPVVTGSQASPSSIYILTNGQPITFTLSGVGSVCVPTQTITCGCPAPKIDTVTDKSFCSAQSVSQINFTTSDPYDSVSWTNDNPAIGLAASGSTFFIPSFTAATVTSPMVANISVILTKNGCPGPARTFKITINPLPTVTVNSPTTCAGTNIAVTATPVPAGTYNYAWTVPAGVTNPGNVASFSTGVAGTYSVIVTNPTTGCSSTSGSGTVTVNALPTVSVSNANVCTGATATVTATPVPAGSYNYVWTVPAGVTNPGNTASFTTTTTGSYSVVVTNTTTNCSSASASGTVSNITNPTVSVANVSACAGSSATVTAVPVPAGSYNYVWTVPAGATNPGNTASFTTTIAGSYSVIVTNISTSCSSVSASGSVTINALPTVTVNSPSACNGSTATVTATPVPAGSYNYVWTVPAGATNPGNVASFGTTIAGNYSVVVTNTTTNCSSTSASGTVTINASPTVTVNNANVCTGASATVTATPTSAGTFNYAWTVPTGATNPGNVASFTTTVAGQYSVIITNTTTNCSSASASGTVSNIALPTVDVNDPSICAGAVATVTATPTPAGAYNYVWTVPAGATNPGNTASFTTSTPGVYGVTVTSIASGCSSAAETGTVSISATPTVNPVIPQPQICSGQSAGIQLVGTPGLATTFTWTYSVSGGAVSGATNGTGSVISDILSVSGTVMGTVTYTITPSAAGCVGTPVTASIDVYPTPTLTVNPASLVQNICSGGTTNIQLISNIPGTTFNWSSNQTNVSGASSVTGNTSGVINQTLSTSGNQSGQVVYAVTPVYGTCFGNTIIVTVNVNPVPTVIANPTTQAICAGTQTSINLSSNVPGTTFSWTVANTNNVIGAQSGNGNTISQTLTVNGFSQGTVDYVVTPTVNGCTGLPVTIPVQVNPRPDIIGSSSATICSGDSTNISLSSTIPTASFVWTVVQNGVTGATSGAATANPLVIQQTLFATGTTAGTATYTIIPKSNDCEGNPITVVITVNPSPDPKIVGGVVCIDSATGNVVNSYTIDTGLTGSQYQFDWYLEPSTTPIPGAHGSTYVATEQGTYTVEVFNNITACYSVKSIDVTEANPAQSATAIVSNYFEDNQAITVVVVGNGSYLYELDHSGIFQESNVFTHVLPGEHTVTIHDTIGCTDIVLEHILTIGYPHFFTPNGDGYNDTWNIWSLQNLQPNAEIHIFDRYGKLIKQIIPAGNGWDGTFNGQLLPSTDYWFTVKYDENGTEKIFKAHFSMKR